jgi:hypothetical protein
MTIELGVDFNKNCEAYGYACYIPLFGVFFFAYMVPIISL